jgi:8-oxo-dGTP pyrophosphatase MutT (NUDIX family)
MIALAEALDQWQHSSDGSSARPWSGWRHDQQLARIYGEQLTRSLAQVEPLDLARLWLESVPSGAVEKSAMPNPAAWGWLVARGIANVVTQALHRILANLWTEGFAVGREAGKEMVDSAYDSTFWDHWQPGDVDAARLVAGDGLQQMLDTYGIQTIKSIADTRMRQLADQLAAGFDSGSSADEIAENIRPILDNPSRDYMIASTELNRATSLAALGAYREANQEGKRWSTAHDERVCPVCMANQEQGIIPIGGLFDSGVVAPPAHPGPCRCAVLPDDLPESGIPPMRLTSIQKAGVVAAGVVLRAADTGRVLMIKRSEEDGDKAPGCWEFPGGTLEPGELVIVAAVREWQEEVGKLLPGGIPRPGWTSSNGVYRAFIMDVANEHCMSTGDRDEVDDPDGTHHEALAWVLPDEIAHQEPLRPELATDLPRVVAALQRPSMFKSDKTAQKVYEQLLENYPPGSIEWVLRAEWSGPRGVTWDEIDHDDMDSWAASHQPGKVGRFADKFRDGEKVKPAVLADLPTKGGPGEQLLDVDGHHRALAARDAGVPLPAWVGKVAYADVPAVLQTHVYQRTSSDPASTAAARVDKETTAGLTGGMVTKVGPHGYIHGWVFVGAPGGNAAHVLDAAHKSGIASEEAGGKTTHATARVKFNDGSEWIRKSGDKTNRDAEVLASRVSDVIGAGAPHVLVKGGKLWQPVVRGKSNVDLGVDSYKINEPGLQKYTKSAAGERIGLLDKLTRNTDRADGNWMVAEDGQPVPIDHSHARYTAPPLSSTGPFRKELERSGARWSAAQWAKWEQGLRALEPEFAQSKRSEWYQALMANFAEARQQATVAKVVQPSLVKVGPKGYIHGWIFVGIPTIGQAVSHPAKGNGKGEVTGINNEGTRATVRFRTGSEHSFEVTSKPVGSGYGSPFQRRLPQTHHLYKLPDGRQAALTTDPKAFYGVNLWISADSKHDESRFSLITRPGHEPQIMATYTDSDDTSMDMHPLPVAMMPSVVERDPEGDYAKAWDALKPMALEAQAKHEAERKGTTAGTLSDLVAKAQDIVPGLLGARDAPGIKSVRVIPEKGNAAILARMGWDNVMQVREDVAKHLVRAVSGTGGGTRQGRVASSDLRGPVTILHELIHAQGFKDWGSDGQNDNTEAYQNPAGAAIEEGFTELGATYHAPEFFQKIGIGDHYLGFGNAPSMTAEEYARGRSTLHAIDSGLSWGHYTGATQAAMSWVSKVASAEGNNTTTRMRELADEINREGPAGKAPTMAKQIMRAAGMNNPDDAQAQRVIAGAITRSWTATTKSLGGEGETIEAWESAMQYVSRYSEEEK